jgi:recombinational DNA repair ATPase RecF
MANDINFDKIRYIELLKKEETFKNQEISLVDENPKERRELFSYKIILENQIYYNRKAEYIFLVEEYLRKNAGEDGARLFVSEFFIIFKKDNKALEILEQEILEQGIKRLATFCIDPKSTKFSALINQIVGLCEFLTFDPEDSYGITLDQFRDSIEKIFFKIQKYLDK